MEDSEMINCTLNKPTHKEKLKLNLKLNRSLKRLDTPKRDLSSV